MSLEAVLMKYVFDVSVYVKSQYGKPKA